MSPDEENDLALVPETVKEKALPPPLYQVVLLNDDYTPMDFVVTLLQEFFVLDETQATTLMLQIHIMGRAVCGVYPKEVAESKVAAINRYSEQHGHPLKCILEPNAQ